jgi:hypothetical protein
MTQSEAAAGSSPKQTPELIGSKWARESHTPVPGSLFVATSRVFVVVDTDHDNLARKRPAQSVAAATDALPDFHRTLTLYFRPSYSTSLRS